MPGRSERVFRRLALKHLVCAASGVDGVAPDEDSALSRYLYLLKPRDLGETVLVGLPAAAGQRQGSCVSNGRPREVLS